MRMKLHGLAFHLVAALAVTATVSPTLAQDRPLVIARDLAINSLDPHVAFCDTCQIYLSATYQGLVKLAVDDRNIEPLLATSWTSNDDQTQFTFNLNPDAVFSDGSPVEAKDVKWTFERLKNRKGDPSFMMSGLSSIETPDTHTVIVNMEKPNSEFLGILAAPYAGIVNSELAQANGAVSGEDAASADTAESWFLQNSAGSGPYVLAGYSPDDELRFARNSNFWGEDAPIGEVVIKHTSAAVSQAQMLQSGAADIAMQIDPDTAKMLVDSPDITIETVPSYNFIYVVFGPGAENKVPLEKNVREALAYALDYKGIIEFTVGGRGEPQASPIPNGFPGTRDLPMPVEDLDRARKLLAEAGLEAGFEIDAVAASMNIYGVDLTLLMQKVQQDLARVNVTVNMQPVANAVWRERVVNPGVSLGARFYAPDYFGSAQYVQFFGMIPGTYWEKNASQGKVDLVNKREVELFEQALAASGEEMENLYREVALEMINDRIIVPVVSPNLVLAYRSDMKGVRYSACCNLPLAEISRE